MYEWLPKVIQKLKPWLSATNIDQGARWGLDIAQNLEQSRFGIIFLTPDNLSAPWILFEAGALSKNIGNSYVCPYLFDYENIVLKGPLAQFQAAKSDKADTKKLVVTINKALGKQKLSEGALDATFEKWWPELESRLKAIAADPAYKRAPYRLRHIIEDYEEDVQTYARNFRRLLDRYGLEAACTLVGVEILDLQGKSKFKRTYRGIKVTSGITVNHIPGSISTSTAEGEFIQYPALMPPAEFEKPLSLVYHTPSPPGRCDFQIKVEDGLRNGDPELSFGYDSVLSKAFCMTKEEVEVVYENEPFKYEYFAADPEIPTDKLIVEVEFPDGFEAEVYPGVFLGRFDFIHEAELQRVKPGFQKTKKGACFEVTEPLIGFSYLLYWLPPSSTG